MVADSDLLSVPSSWIRMIALAKRPNKKRARGSYFILILLASSTAASTPWPRNAAILRFYITTLMAFRFITKLFMIKWFGILINQIQDVWP